MPSTSQKPSSAALPVSPEVATKITVFLLPPSFFTEAVSKNGKEFDKVLSLDLIGEKSSIDPELESYILNKIEERKHAKMNKDFTLADSIRQELEEKGILIKDTREGTTYEIK